MNFRDSEEEFMGRFKGRKGEGRNVIIILKKQFNATKVRILIVKNAKINLEY